MNIVQNKTDRLKYGWSYGCYICRDFVTKNCGHSMYGKKRYLVSQNYLPKYRCYWCSDCKDKQHPYGRQVFEDCGHLDFNNYWMLRDVSPGKCYTCDTCDKIVNYNCGHYAYGDKYYLVDISGQRKNIRQQFKQLNIISKYILRQLKLIQQYHKD